MTQYLYIALVLIVLNWTKSVITHYPFRNPFRGYPMDPTFAGIEGRREYFDVETPMAFPRDSSFNRYPEELSQHEDHQELDRHLDEQLDDYASESQSDQTLEDGCLRCLCEASSDCDPRVRCHVVGPNDLYCGAFQINFHYWSDAGQPGADVNNPNDFEDCLNDIECSIDAVNGYMRKWARDCDGDGKITCDDFARIHKAGPWGCNSTWVLRTPYWSTYRDCFFEYK